MKSRKTYLLKNLYKLSWACPEPYDFKKRNGNDIKHYLIDAKVLWPDSNIENLMILGPMVNYLFKDWDLNLTIL